MLSTIMSSQLQCVAEEIGQASPQPDCRISPSAIAQKLKRCQRYFGCRAKISINVENPVRAAIDMEWNPRMKDVIQVGISRILSSNSI